MSDDTVADLKPFIIPHLKTPSDNMWGSIKVCITVLLESLELVSNLTGNKTANAEVSFKGIGQPLKCYFFPTVLGVGWGVCVRMLLNMCSSMVAMETCKKLVDERYSCVITTSHLKASASRSFSVSPLLMAEWQPLHLI